MSKIIAIMGLSGVGKTTVARKLSKKLDIPIAVSYTTRPKRPSEKHGVDYIFITNDMWNFFDSTNRIVAKQEFKVANGQIWKYGMSVFELTENCVAILTPGGVNELRKLGYDIKAIYLEVDENERLKRILNRNDNQSKEEIKRRSIADKEVFEDFTPDIVIQNNKNINLVVDEIINFVEGI